MCIGMANGGKQNHIADDVKMMSRMTDKEIIKALECCTASKQICPENCPLVNDTECGVKVKENALDLINRQQSAIDVYMQENDRLKTAYIQVSMDRDEAKAEIERLNYILIRDNQRQTEKEQKEGNCISTLYDLYDKEVDENKKLKAEIERLQEYYDDMQGAIYSFREDHAKVKFFKGEIRAEAIKEFAERLKNKYEEDMWAYEREPLNEYIDDLVKEMVGEGK